MGIYRSRFPDTVGVTWQPITTPTSGGQPIYVLSFVISNQNVVAGSNNNGIYYSTLYGDNWTPSNIISGAWYLAKSVGSGFVIAGSATDPAGNGSGLKWSNNIGQTWNPSNITSGGFPAVALSGTKGIAGNVTNTASSLGIYYTSNSGVTWAQSTIAGTSNPLTYDFLSVALSSDGIYGVAGSIGYGIWYSTNSGVTWTQSNIGIGIQINSIALSGTIGIAGSQANGIYTGANSGQRWSPSNITATSISQVAISGTNGIAGSKSNLGIYYNITSLCYEKNTLILVLENEVELYKKICELKVGDTVKTYKHGYKNIKLIDSFHYNPSYTKRNKRLLYKMISYDVIVTGKHGFLVDELTEQEIFNTKKCGTTIRYIDDKKVLPACASDKFEKVMDDKDFELWHFVLENDDESKNYGVYINDGVLSESCSEDCFKI